MKKSCCFWTKMHRFSSKVGSVLVQQRTTAWSTNGSPSSSGRSAAAASGSRAFTFSSIAGRRKAGGHWLGVWGAAALAAKNGPVLIQKRTTFGPKTDSFGAKTGRFGAKKRTALEQKTNRFGAKNEPLWGKNGPLRGKNGPLSAQNRCGSCANWRISATKSLRFLRKLDSPRTKLCLVGDRNSRSGFPFAISEDPFGEIGGAFSSRRSAFLHRLPSRLAGDCWSRKCSIIPSDCLSV